MSTTATATTATPTETDTSARLGRAAVILGQGHAPSDLYALFHKNDEVLQYQRITSAYDGEEALQKLGEALAMALCPETMSPEELYRRLEVQLDG